MKKSTKIVISVAVAVTLIVVGGIFLSDYSTYSQMISGYFQKEKIISKNDVNEDGNIVLLDDVPYYGYLDKKDVTCDSELLSSYELQSYFAKENEDYLISDYKDGVCIDRYFAEEEKVLIIPETLDGKKVVKIGVCCWDTDTYTTLLAYGPDPETGSPITEELYIPSGVKEIVYHSFAIMPQLKTIVVDEKNPYYYSKNGNLYCKENDKLLLAPKYRYYAEPEYYFSETE